MSITVTVTDMSCDGCEDIVEGAVADVAGVESVEADRETESVVVDGDADVEAVMEAIDFAGYSPSRREEGDNAVEADEDDADGDDAAAEVTDADEGDDEADDETEADEE